MLKIYNTLSHKKEIFKPINPGEVKMYGCGVTPYKPAHLGHAMQAVIFDVIRRYLEYKGYKVTYVRNYTDIEDRIIKRAIKSGLTPLEYSQKVIDECEDSFDKLRIRKPDYSPKVSNFLPEIIETVQQLVDKGHAYITKKGNVYFSVKTFPEYGKLSRQRFDQIRQGVRKNVEKDKNNPMDFALWKSEKDGEISWNSPWGKGRPGWHIECSVMSMYHLGRHFDIHGGGTDLIFPHHENEIAQSESLNNGKFVNYWIHNGLLMVGKKKMSKSLGNDITISDWLKIYHPEVIRYMILTNHYRSHVQFVESRYREANKNVYEIYKTLEKIKILTKETTSDNAIVQDLLLDFEKNMDNDFNTVPVIAKIHKSISEINQTLMNMDYDLDKIKSYYSFIKSVGSVLGLFDLDPEIVITEIEDLYLANIRKSRKDIEKLINLRKELRESYQYKEADVIRNSLEKIGINLLDEKDITRWEVAF